jgi:hypothetical protein
MATLKQYVSSVNLEENRPSSQTPGNVPILGNGSPHPRIEARDKKAGEPKTNQTENFMSKISAHPPERSNPNRLLKLKEAGDEVGLTIWQIRGLIATQQLPVVRVGRKFYIRLQALNKWAERAEGLVAA